LRRRLIVSTTPPAIMPLWFWTKPSETRYRRRKCPLYLAIWPEHYGSAQARHQEAWPRHGPARLALCPCLARPVGPGMARIMGRHDVARLFSIVDEQLMNQSRWIPVYKHPSLTQTLTSSSLSPLISSTAPTRRQEGAGGARSRRAMPRGP
jgi:hypothetical protein